MSLTREEGILLTAFRRYMAKPTEGESRITAFDHVGDFAETIANVRMTVTKMQETFTAVGRPNLMLTCPTEGCGTPVLLEFHQCPICQADLLGGQATAAPTPFVDTTPVGTTADTVAATPTAPAKVKKEKTPKAEKRAASEKAATAAVATAVEAKEVDLPIGKGTTQEMPKLKSNLPDDKKIDAVDYKGLQTIVAEFKLDKIQEDQRNKIITKVSEYRAAVKTAVKELRQKESQVTPTKSEPVQTAVVSKASTKKSKAEGKSTDGRKAKDDGVAGATNLGSGKGKPVEAKATELEEEIVVEEPLDEVEAASPFEMEPAVEEEIAEVSEDDISDEDLDFDLDNVSEGEDDDAATASDDDDDWGDDE